MKYYYKFMVVMDVKAKSIQKAEEIIRKNKKIEVTKIEYMGKIAK